MRRSSVVLSTFAIAACASGSGGASASPAAASAPASASASVGPGYTATIRPMASGGAQMNGTLKLTPTSSGDYRVELSVRTPSGAMQQKYPWILRTGQCGETNTAAELGNPVAYRMLETASDGSARVNFTLKVPLQAGGVYHIDILRSPTERESVVACGVLSPTS